MGVKPGRSGHILIDFHQMDMSVEILRAYLVLSRIFDCLARPTAVIGRSCKILLEVLLIAGPTVNLIAETPQGLVSVTFENHMPSAAMVRILGPTLTENAISDRSKATMFLQPGEYTVLVNFTQSARQELIHEYIKDVLTVSSAVPDCSSITVPILELRPFFRRNEDSQAVLSTTPLEGGVSQSAARSHGVLRRGKTG